MTPQAIFHRYFPILYLCLAGLLGWTGGWLGAVILGIWLNSPVESGDPGPAFQTATVQKRPLGDYQVILDRNLFNSAAGAAGFSEPAGAAPVAAPAREQGARPQVPLNLLGTVVAGDGSLALIRDGREIRVYRLGEEVGGRTVNEITRHMVVLRHRDGRLENLALPTEPLQQAKGSDPAVRAGRGRPAAAAPPSAARFNVQQVGENKWHISREAADHARGNLNELLTQAHMEPRIVAGETRGFMVRMIRPGSFFDVLGLRRGDVLMEINDIQLNSPERALQIFQQLREARDIKISLLRNDEPMTFEYETN